MLATPTQGLLTVDEAAQLLGFSPKTVRHWIFYGLVPVVKLGRSVRFKAETIEQIRSNGLPSTRRYSGNQQNR